MLLRFTRLVTVVCLAGLLFLAACSSTKTPTAVVITEIPTTIATTYPGPAPDVTQGSKVETTYPGPASPTNPGDGGETAYPGPASQLAQGSEVGSAYPAPGSYPAPGQANTVQSPSGQDAYPAPGTTGQNQQPAAPSAYPAPGSEVQQPPASNTPYPGPQTDTPAAPTPDVTAPNRDFQTPTPLISVPTTTQTPMTSLTPLPTGTPIATSTPTPTEIEVDPNFHPTDPSTVRLDSGKVQLVEFFTYWCGECRALAPLVHSLEIQYQDRMNFIYLDTDNPATLELKRTLGYRDQPDNPQFFLLDASGKIIKKWVGVVSAEDFRNSFDAALMK